MQQSEDSDDKEYNSTKEISSDADITSQNNMRTLKISVFIIAVMLALAALSVPAYQIFCKVTGYGGTPSIVEGDFQSDNPDHANLPSVKVLFDATVDPDLPWSFYPAQRSITVEVGKTYKASYFAKNKSGESITGMATFNVAPSNMGQYFHKIECFCFTQQVLAPGEKAEFTLTFYVSPEMFSDSSTMDMRSVTLSYTFFRDPSASNQIDTVGQAETP